MSTSTKSKQKKPVKPVIKKLEEVQKLFEEVCKDANEVLTSPEKKVAQNGSIN